MSIQLWNYIQTSNVSLAHVQQPPGTTPPTKSDIFFFKISLRIRLFIWTDGIFQIGEELPRNDAIFWGYKISDGTCLLFRLGSLLCMCVCVAILVRMGLTKQIFSIPLISPYLLSRKTPNNLMDRYHVSIFDRCRRSCWYLTNMRVIQIKIEYCYKTNNFYYWEINERSFSNPTTM